MAKSMSQFSKEYASTLKQKNLSSGAAKRTKHGSKKTEVGDITFDSKVEAKFYGVLLLHKKIGTIKNIELQPKYLLLESFVDRSGITHKPVYYISDFEVQFPDGTIKVYDTKGNKTKDYILKKKFFLSRYQDVIFEEVYIPDAHPITDKILSADEVEVLRAAGEAAAAAYYERFIAKK